MCRRRCIKLLIAGFALTGLAPQASADDLLVALRLNGQQVSDGEIVTVTQDKIFLPLSVTQQLRLTIPPTLIANYPETIPLNDLQGVAARLDRQALVLDINADPEAFQTMVLENYVPTRPPDSPDNPGLFLNYSLLGQDTGTSALTSGLFSLGGFSDLGVGIMDVTASNDQGARRLRNYLRRDLPDQKGSVVFGDSFLPSGAIGQQFPFGGVQFSSRMTDNDVRQIPVETMMGAAALPSSVDVFVNDSLQSHQIVPAGPFVLENVPVATGDGNIRVVVRDALGQERVLVKSFYTSPYLLTENSSEYSYEGGLLRRNYGVASFDYAEPFFSGTQRYGWSKELTTEIHGEMSAQRQIAGGQASFLVYPIGTLRIGAAASNHEDTPGFLGLLGAETTTQPVSLGISNEISTAHFTQLGYTGDRTLRQSSQVRAAYNLAEAGSLSASLIRLAIAGQNTSNTAALSYNLVMQQIGFVGLSAFKTLGNGITGATLNLSVPLGQRGSLSAQTTHDQNGWSQVTQYVQNVPNDGGYGYRAMFDHDPSTNHGEIGSTYRSPYNEVSFDAGVVNRSPIGRASATGSLGFLKNQAFASRGTDGNFAVVDTSGIGGIHVYADQQPVGITDGSGKLVIPHLRANEINRIAIDPADVPFDVEVRQSEQEIIPRSQTGYLVKFLLVRSRSARATLMMDNNQPVPAGCKAHDAANGKDFIVGYDGLIYLTNLTGKDTLSVTLPEGGCAADIILPHAAGVQPDLGFVTCHS